MAEPTPAARPAVSVIVVTWNCRDAVLECLSSLSENPPGLPWEAIVVDNASTDGTAGAIQEAFAGVKCLVNDSNRGLAAANNQGMRQARGEFFLIANPDVVFSAGAIDALVGTLRRHPNAAFAFAKLLEPDGSVQTSAGDLPSALDALRPRRRVHSERRATALRSGVWWDAWDHGEEVQVGHGGEACYLARRRAVDEIGYQDERFKFDWEGVEWCSRAQRAGWESWFCPGAEVVHLGGVSVRQVGLAWVVRTHLALYRYIQSRVGIAALVLVPLIVARAVTKVAALVAGRRLYERAHRTAR